MKPRAAIERFGVVGFNHRLIPARLRGALAFDVAWCERLAKQLRDANLAEGVAFVSTCNRQEVVLSASHPGFATELVRAQLKDLLAGTVEEVPEPYRHVGEDAVRHVLRVSASLDSLVVGERQITQQLRRSFDASRTHGWMDKPLNGLARIAVENAKEIHTRTALGAESVGVFSIARALVKRETAGLERPRVAVVGLGEIGLKTARTLASEGRYELVISSRRARTAKELGTTLERARFVPLEALGTVLTDCDAVVLATGASAPVVSVVQLQEARKAAGKALVLVDLGIPPQADAECDGQVGTQLFNLDWFTATGFGQKPQAKEALQQAQAIVEEGVARVAEWTSVRRFSALFDSCVTLTEQYKVRVLPELVRGELAALSPEQQRAVLSSMHRLLTSYSEGVFEALHRELVDRPESARIDDDERSEPVGDRQPRE